MDQIILSYHDSIIYQSDLKILKTSTEWLNDRIITFYFEYLTRSIFDDEQILLIGPEVTQAIKMMGNGSDIRDIFLSPLNCDERDLIVFAINDSESETNSGSHWSLCVFSRSDNKFFHFDSLDGHNHASCVKLVKILVEALRVQKADLIEVECLQQSNSYDCGIFVLCHADQACQTFMRCRSLMEIKKIKPVKTSTKRSEILEIIDNLKATTT